MQSPIIFFGTEEFSAASLQALIDAQFTIAAVVTKPDTKKGRGQTLIPPTVKVIAEQYNIPVWQPPHLQDITKDIIALQPVAGVLVSFGKIIPQAMIDLFTPGIINVHPSHLPLYRGPSPIESAILNGDSSTGVSIMQLSAKMDAGPVYYFAPYLLQGDETQAGLYATLAEYGAEVLVTNLPAILSGELRPVPQDEAAATYCQLLKKTDSLLSWEAPVSAIERHIRAYNVWPGSRADLNGHEVIITAAHSSTIDRPLLPGQLSTEDGLLVGTATTPLEITSLKPVGKKEMSAREFINGYGHLLTKD